MMKNYKALLLNYDEYRALDHLHESVQVYCNSESKKWELEYDEIKDEDSVLADNAISHLCVFEQLSKISEELIVLGLYKKVELTTKSLVGVHFPNEDLSNLYQFKAVSDLLRKLGVKLEAIDGYNQVDELRCLCNAIKHRGIVTEALAKYSTWRKGEDIEGMIIAYKRITPFVKKYLSDMDNKLWKASNKQSHIRIEQCKKL